MHSVVCVIINKRSFESFMCLDLYSVVRKADDWSCIFKHIQQHRLHCAIDSLKTV